jgi:hypothetical protein
VCSGKFWQHRLLNLKMRKISNKYYQISIASPPFNETNKSLQLAVPL